MAGIYTWLPLGLRVLKKIEQIVREEQNRAGAIELLMPTLQSAELWRESGRYDAYGPEMLRIRDRHDRDRDDGADDQRRRGVAGEEDPARIEALGAGAAIRSSRRASFAV